MTKLDQVQFWREQYDRGGNSIERWIDKARSLLDAANVLDAFHGSLLEDLMQETEQRELSDLEWQRLSVRDVSPMLLAMATECLLKALWLKQGGVLAENGAYRGILRGSEHQLDELAVAVGAKAGIVFPHEDLELLKLVSNWIVVGRYPIPRTHDRLSALERVPHGRPIPRRSWPEEPVARLRELTQQLMHTLLSPRCERPGAMP